ncbi:MAG: agmatine deiminase family protein [Alphaproteobacteria bacterium]|nr:agmatine deiminase family protein [Alphaproteobacteria bacterium]
MRAWIWAAALALALALASSVSGAATAQEVAALGDGELIVLAAPRADDSYYAPMADAIVAFHIRFAKALAGGDRALILTDAATRPHYVQALGEEAVLVAPMEDVWARDFSLTRPERPVRFRYTAEGQGGGRGGQRDADWVQSGFERLAAAAGLDYRVSTLFNDGGNLVDDYAGAAVLSRKVLRDNGLTEAEGRAALREEAGLETVAFIEADEQGGLEHADGVVAFLEPGVLVVNRYPDDPDYAAALRADLERGLPGVALHEIPAPYDDSAVYDARFGSACGLYTNMVVTPHRIYLPQFGVPEDSEALALIESLTDKQVVPVESGGVCSMGGGVRCMSWQVRGENAARLLGWRAARAPQ